MLLQILLRHGSRLRVVHCQQALVKMRIGREHRLIPKQDVKKRQGAEPVVPDHRCNGQRCQTRLDASARYS